MNPKNARTFARPKTVRRIAILTVLTLGLSSLMGLTAISVDSTPAEAAVFDAAAFPLKFDSTNRVAISPAGNTGLNAGDVLRYNGVTTINGTVIDAVVRVVSLDTGGTVVTLDVPGNGGAYGNPAAAPPGSTQTVGDALLTNIDTVGVAAGSPASVTLDISFYEGGTYTGTGSGVPVTLTNVKVNSYDVDGNGGTNGTRQFVEFRGFQSYLTYTGAAPQGLTISNQSDGFARFTANTSTAATGTSGSYSWSRVQVNYDRTSSMRVRLGALGPGGAFFALDYSAGGIWTTTNPTVVTPTQADNPNNRPPTTANVSLLRATVNSPTVLTVADFPYSDLDDNAMASVRIVTVVSATDATLEYFNGTAWQPVANGFVITTSDLDLGKLRLTPLTPSGSLTFQVNDGLVYSTTATLSYTSPPNGQTITFANPGTRAPGATFASGATASSGLTPSLTSQTPSVCTVSGLSISTLALPSGVTTAICVITATQDGNATYGRADAVTQQFSVSSLLAQTISFADPADRAFTTTPIVSGAVAAPSGLPVTLASLTPNVCTVSGGNIVPVTPGICSVRATQAGNGTYAAASPVSQSLTLLPAVQTITFAQPADQLINGGPLVVAPTASSGLTPTLASSTPAVCTVSGFSIAFVSVGECTVTASQAGDATYGPATPVTRSFDITTVSQTITFAQPADQFINGGPLVVAPTASSGLTPTLSSSIPAVCTVSGMSITFVSAGECTVSADQDGNATYAAAVTVTRSFDIDLVAQSITFPAVADRELSDGPVTVAPTASSGLTPTLTSNTPTVCTVSGTTITTLTPGECSITASQTGNSVYAPAIPVTRTFDVGLLAQTISFAQPADQLIDDGPLVVAPTASSGLTPTLTSSTPTVCTVSGFSIAFVSVGECTVTAAQPGNSTYSAATPVTRSFDLTAVSQSVTFAQPADQLINGGPLVVAPTASSGLTPTLTSSTPTVCTVSGFSIAFVSAGECTVTADQPGNATYSAATPVTRSFDITTVSQSVIFAQPADQLINGGPLVVAPTASSGLTPVLTSGTPTVCTVSGFSIAFVSAGECTVTADQPGDATYGAAAPVTRSFDIALVAQTITFAPPADQSMDDATLVVTPTASSGLTPTLTSSTPTVCTVSGLTVTFVGAGLCTVTADQAGDGTYDAAPPVTHSFEISSVSQTITFAPPADQLINGGPLVVAPTASSGLTPTLTTSTPTICSVSGMGISFLAAGECTVTASQAGDATYDPATPVTRSFDIALVAQTLTFAQPADQLVNGGPLVVAPTASSGLTPVLTSSTPTACTVSGMSIAFVSAGECTVTASQPGDGSYSAATSVTHSFDIALVAQTITFTDPADQPILNGPLVVAPTASSGLTPVLTSSTTAVCTVAGFTVSFVTTGECTVTASQAGDGIYEAATPVTHSFDITALPQTITFPSRDDVSLGDPAVVLTATTDAAGLTPTLTSGTPAVCTVFGFTVTFVGPGLCTITASQPGSATYSPAVDVVRSFRVLTITTTALPSMTAGSAVNQPVAVAGAAGGGTWSSSSPLPAGLSLNPTTGVITGTPTVSFSGYVTFVYTESGVSHDASLLLSISAAGGLAHSGTDSLLPIGIGIVLLLLGALAVGTTARRRSRLA